MSTLCLTQAGYVETYCHTTPMMTHYKEKREYALVVPVMTSTARRRRCLIPAITINSDQPLRIAKGTTNCYTRYHQ